MEEIEEPPPTQQSIRPFLDESFQTFMRENNIPHDAYNIDEISRFIRINPRAPITKEDLEEQLGATVTPVPWLPYFYKLHKDVSIASCEAYKQGQIYGIDVSSGLVVYALDCQKGDNILDVCCAPGSKYCLIADCMDHKGTVTGVDISAQRISVCKTVVKKYFHLGGRAACPARLFLTDGSTFSVLAPLSKFGSGPHAVASTATTVSSDVNTNAVDENSNKETINSNDDTNNIPTKSTSTNSSNANNLNTTTNTPTSTPTQETNVEPNTSTTSTSTSTSSTETAQVLPTPTITLPPLPSGISKDSTPPPKKKRRKGREKDLPNLYFSNDYSIRNTDTGAVQLYDRILVDAECTLDASVRHLLLHSKTSPKITTTPELTELQRRLIYNAFRLLKPGGTMVYSTCSFCESQNEDVVKYLIDHEPTARVVPIPNPVPNEPIPYSAGSLQHTVRLYPRVSGTSGMFIAKIIKVSPV